VAVAAAGRMIPFSLELGGKNPMIVLKDAPVEAASDALIAGAFANAGQSCISIERVYVEDALFEPFVRRVAEKASRLKLGWSRSWDTDIGSLITPAHAAKVMAHIGEALARGASVRAGGRLRADLGPGFVEPTVLVNVHDDTAVSNEETFGPVVALYPVKTPEEAIARANDSTYGLNASVWGGSRGASMRVARQIEAGSVGIASTLMVYNTFDVPMGGIKQSGIGRRHGGQGILRYTAPQSIVTSFGAGGGYDGAIGLLRSDARVRWLLRSLRWWRRMPGIR
jgi:acyl-CoA reductase-like NAD-dependent aldehyde dehydrogenase